MTWWISLINGNMNDGMNMNDDNDIESKWHCVLLVCVMWLCCIQCRFKLQEWRHDMNNNLIDDMMDSCNEW